MSAELYEA